MTKNDMYLSQADESYVLNIRAEFLARPIKTSIIEVPDTVSDQWFLSHAHMNYYKQFRTDNKLC